MNETKRRPGRPPLPPGQVKEVHAFRIEPKLWKDVEEWIPEGERSAVVSKAFEREISKRKRAKRHDELLAEDGLPTGD